MSSKKPQIHLYTICWNEEYMLKHFFKYYDPLVDRYVFFDDGSTDETLNILKKHPKVEVRPFPYLDDVDSYVLAAQNLHNTCWKESRNIADWVILTAVDEFLYTLHLAAYLTECTQNGITAIPALGFQMISTALPSVDQSLPDQIRRGCPWVKMNKLSIFDPSKISETGQMRGRHTAKPEGIVKYPEKDMLLNLHYKYLSFEHTFQRHAELGKKLGAIDKKHHWGNKYGWSREQFEKDWDYFAQNAIENVFADDYNPHLDHSPLSERWWRMA